MFCFTFLVNTHYNIIKIVFIQFKWSVVIRYVVTIATFIAHRGFLQNYI